MKVLFVINQLVCGGAEQQLVTLCEALKRRGHQLAVVSIYDQLELRARLDAIQVPIAVAYKYSKLDLTIVWRVHQLIKKFNPDLVHAYLPAACLFTGMTKWLGVNVPILQAERSVNSWRSKWRVSLDNIVRRKVAHIVCNAEAIRNHLAEAEYVPWRKISVIYNGLAPERRTRPPKKMIQVARKQIDAPPGSFVVTCVANFVAEKQHKILLEAFALAKQQVKKLFLVLIGQGELEQEVRTSIRQLRLADASRMVCNCNDPLPFLSASDAAMLTSSVEGCSNALLEAMAVGLPVVTTDAGGNRELVTHDLGGIVCPVGDVSSLAAGLVRLARNPALSRGMGIYNADRVEKEFTDDILVEHTLGLYDRIMTESIRENEYDRPIIGLQTQGDRRVRDRRMAGSSDRT